MLKYTYTQVFPYDLILHTKIDKSLELAECFFAVCNAIYTIYDWLQDPTGYEQSISPEILNNYKYKNIILSNFKREPDQISNIGFPECFSELDLNLEKISKLTGLPDIDQKIILFVCQKPYRYFRNTCSVFREQLEALGNRYDHCNRNYICLYENNNLVISMFVFVFEKDKQQAHFYIVKELFYSLEKFVNGQPELQNSSILLHSFAAYIFNSDQFFTQPMASMVEIFQRNNINTAEPATPEEKVKWDKIIKDNRTCYPFLEITHIYSTADIKFKWLTNFPFDKIINEIDHIFFVPKILKGGASNYKKLAYKYKTKYLKLKNLIN